MTSFSWLHLTDLHCGMREQRWLWPGVRERFFTDLQRLHERCGPWDLVLFTGDLTQKGSPEEFQRFDDILGQLWAHLTTLESTPYLLAVPGNHDLVRPDPRDPAMVVLQQWQTLPEIRNQFWNEADSPYRQVVERAFANYLAWWQRQPNKVPGVRTGQLPGDVAVTIPKGEARLGLVGLNTTFLQLTGGDYEGKLALHASQLHTVCDGDGPAWARRHHACMLLTHQPPTWLTPEALQHLEGEIVDHGRFAVHLCGHMHETVYRDVAEAGAEARRLWQGRALFGLEFFGEKQEIQRLHGYTAGKIDLRAPDTGSLTFWPREARVQGAQRDIVPDYSVRLTDAQQTAPKDFPLLRPYRHGMGEDRPAMGEHLGVRHLIQQGILEALAQSADNAADADFLLAAMGFPGGSKPNFNRLDNSLGFWLEVCQRLENGLVPGGLEALLAAAARRFPGNPKF